MFLKKSSNDKVHDWKYYAFIESGSGTYSLCFTFVNDPTYTSKNYAYSVSSDFSSCSTLNNHDFYDIEYKSISSNCDTIYYYTECDIYYSSDCEDVFFQGPPLTVLAQELEKVEAAEVFKKMTKNVVISLLVCLIGFLSLRKGWTFLKTALRKA